MTKSPTTSPAPLEVAAASQNNLSLQKATPRKKSAADAVSAGLTTIEGGGQVIQVPSGWHVRRLAYKLPEAAKAIGCCNTILWKWIKEGVGPKSFHLNGKKHLILAEDLEKWLKDKATAQDAG